MKTPSDLRDAKSWARTGENLIEAHPYAIQRMATVSGVIYLLWRSRISLSHETTSEFISSALGRFASAELARNAAADDREYRRVS